MSTKRHLDRTHPDCEAYSRTFKALWDAYLALETQERAKFPDWRGQDNPAYAVLTPARKQFYADIKALQEQYSYLFIEVEEEEPCPAADCGEQAGDLFDTLLRRLEGAD